MEHKSESSLRKSFEKGIDLYCRGEYELAADCLMKIEAAYPRASLFLGLIEKKQRPGIVKADLIDSQNKLETLSALALAKDSISRYEYGLYYFARGCYEEAVKCFQQAPGDPYAQYRLGLCHAQGKWVERDLVKAAEYFRAAAAQGHEQATFYLSLCCLEDEKIAQKHNPWFGTAVAEGNANQHAQFYVGFCHWMGKGVHSSYEEAVRLLLPICPTGHALALYYVAISYYNEPNLAACNFSGLSEKNDNTHTSRAKTYFLAERYARLAALKGNSDAQYTLAMFLLEGFGGKQNFEEAYEWFGKAAAQGHEEASECLELFRGFKLPVTEKSLEFYKIKATTGGFSEASKHLREKLFAKQGYLKEPLDKMFTFESASKPASPVNRTSPPVKSTSPQLLAENKADNSPVSSNVSVSSERENKSINTLPTASVDTQENSSVPPFELFVDGGSHFPPMPEVKAVQESQKTPDFVNIETTPVASVDAAVEPQRPLTPKQNPEEAVAVVSVSPSQVTPPDSPPPVASESKLEPKKKKEKKAKQRADSLNDKKRGPTPPLSLDEAQGLLNKVIANKTLDTSEEEQLSLWFETENVIEDNKNASSHYCLGLYWGYVVRNPLQAFLYYEKAAELDLTHAGAHYHLGLCYGESGKNFKNNIPMSKHTQKALDHYQIAADNGHERATRALDKVKRKREKKEAQKKAQTAVSTSAMSSVSPTQEAKSDSAEVSLTPLDIEPHPPLEIPSNTSQPEAKSSGDETVNPASDQDDKSLPKGLKRNGKQAFKEGKKAYGLAQYSKAKAKFKEAADAKNLLACLYYGVVLKETDPDNEEAETYFNKVQGQPWFLEQLEKLDKIDQLKKADAQKVFNNLFYVGLYCEFASDGTVDKLTKKRAFEYYEKSARNGCVEAQNYLGKHYFAKRDYNEAARWFDKAEFENKDVNGSYYIGLFHLNGFTCTIEQSERAALSYFGSAANEGHALAQYQLGLCYLKDDTEEGNEKAYAQFKLSAASGCLEAMCSLAECYWYGWGVEADPVEAEKILSVVALHGQAGKKLLDELKKKPGNNGRQEFLKRFLAQLQNDINIMQGLQELPVDSKNSSNATPLPVIPPSKKVEKEEDQAAESKQLMTNQEIDALLEEGVKAYELTHTAKAIEVFEKIASREPIAYVYLGLMCTKRECDENNLEIAYTLHQEAHKFYQKAREQEELFSTPKPGREFFSGLFYQHASQPQDLKKAMNFYNTVINKESGLMKFRANFYSASSCFVKDGDYEAVALAGYAPAQMEVGMRALRRYSADSGGMRIFKPKAKSYSKTIDFLGRAADQGHLGARYCLGRFLSDIENVKKEEDRDYSKAIEHLTIGADSGDFDAQELLTQCISKQKQILVKKEVNEEASADFTVGEFDQDRFEEAMKANDLEQYPKALKIFQEAAEAKYPPAYIFLGVMYEKGFGVTADVKKSEEYCEEACKYLTTYFSKPGNEFYLGLLYEFAMQPKDEEKAAKYYKIAADKKQHGQMQYRAQYALGTCYFSMGDNESTNICQKRADAEGNYAPAQFELGLASGIQFHGEDSDELRNQHYKDAATLLRKAADQGHVGAQYRLAQLVYDAELAKPKDIKKDYSEAIKYLNLAVGHEHLEAQCLLGQCYFHGRGVTKDYQKAAELLEKAFAKGREDVSPMLEQCKKEQEQAGLSPVTHSIFTGDTSMMIKELAAILEKGISKEAIKDEVTKLFQFPSSRPTPIKEEKTEARKSKKAKVKDDAKNTQPARNVRFFPNSVSNASSESAGATPSLVISKIIEKSQKACETPLDLGSVSSTTSTSLLSSSNK